jgi:WD40 repeat protein
LFVICAEGECHIFRSIVSQNQNPLLTNVMEAVACNPRKEDIVDEGAMIGNIEYQTESKSQADNTLISETETSPTTPLPVEEDEVNAEYISTCQMITPWLTQRIPYNITCALLLDYDLDGKSELILGSNDRNLYVYKLDIEQKQLIRVEKIPMDDNQVYSLTKHRNANGREDILIGFVAGGYAYMESSATRKSHNNIRFFKAMRDALPKNMVTELQMHRKATRSTTRKPGYRVELNDEDSELVFSKQSSVISKPLFVLGNVNWDGDSKELAAFVTVDGTLTVHDATTGPVEPIWRIDLQQEIITIFQYDFTENSPEMHLCLTTWDGITFIIDSRKNIVCFNLQERVSAFYAGYYSLSRDKPRVLCLFFVTFTDKIYVYYNVKQSSIPAYTLKYALSTDTEALDIMNRLFEKLRIFSLDDPEASKLLHSILYDFNDKQLSMLASILQEKK